MTGNRHAAFFSACLYCRSIFLNELHSVANLHAASALVQNLRLQARFGFGVERAFQGVLPRIFQSRHGRGHDRPAVHEDFQFFGLRDADRKRGHGIFYRYFFDSRDVFADAGDHDAAGVLAEQQVFGKQVVAAQVLARQFHAGAEVARETGFGDRHRQPPSEQS